MLGQNQPEFVTRELAARGLPTDPVEACVALLSATARNDRLRIDLAETADRLDLDNDIVRAALAREKLKTASLARECASLTTSLSTLQISSARTQASLSSAETQVRTLTQNLSTLKSQFVHNSRKLARDGERIKHQLAKVIGDRSVSNVSFTLANPLPPTTSKQGVKHVDEDEAMLKLILDDHHKTVVDLTLQNTILTNLLKNMHTRLAQITNTKLVQAGAFRLDISRVNSVIEESFMDACLVLEEMELEYQNSGIVVKDLGTKILKLETEIESYVKLVSSLKASSTKPTADSDIEYRIGVDAHAETNRIDFSKLKLALENDRKLFGEAAVKLGVERAALNREKLSFEEQLEKFNQKSRNGARLIPETPNWMKALNVRTDELKAQVSPSEIRGERTFAEFDTLTPSSLPARTRAREVMDVDTFGDVDYTGIKTSTPNN